MAFDAEYSRWLEEKNKRMNEMRSALNAHAGDGELLIIVDGVMAHYEELFRIKSNAAKNDVFHLLYGMWKTPAERCFLWLGGFRSSEILKVSSVPKLPFVFFICFSNNNNNNVCAKTASGESVGANDRETSDGDKQLARDVTAGRRCFVTRDGELTTVLS